MMRQAPRRHDGPAAGHDAGDPLGGQRHIAQQHPGVHGHVVHALLALLDHGVAVDLPGQLGRIALDLLQRLIDRHRADRHRRVAQDPFAGGMDVLAGGQIHDGVRAPAGGPHHLVDLLGDRRRHRRVADVGVDLHREGLADDHRLALGMVVVGRDHRAAAGNLVANQFGRHVFAGGDESHLRGDLTGAGPLQLGAAIAHHARARRQPGRHVDHRVGVGVGAGGVVEVEVLSVRQDAPAGTALGRRRNGLEVSVELAAASDGSGGHGRFDSNGHFFHLPTSALPGQVRTVDGPEPSSQRTGRALPRVMDGPPSSLTAARPHRRRAVHASAAGAVQSESGCLRSWLTVGKRQTVQ